MKVLDSKQQKAKISFDISPHSLQTELRSAISSSFGIPRTFLFFDPETYNRVEFNVKNYHALLDRYYVISEPCTKCFETISQSFFETNLPSPLSLSIYISLSLSSLVDLALDGKQSNYQYFYQDTHIPIKRGDLVNCKQLECVIEVISGCCGPNFMDPLVTIGPREGLEREKC